MIVVVLFVLFWFSCLQRSLESVEIDRGRIIVAFRNHYGQALLQSKEGVFSYGRENILQVYRHFWFQITNIGPPGRLYCLSASAWYADGRGFDHHVRQHSFVEFGHEIISTAILSLPLIQEGQLSVTGEITCTKYW